jgi:DnaJ-class molecular chaperone
MGIMKRYYFENSVYCGNCNGEGWACGSYCKVCRGTGLDTRTKFLREQKGDLITLSIQYTKSLNEIRK